MTTPSTDTSVAALVTDRPARARVFEQLGIDYCCGGDHSLAEACRTHDLDPDTVVRMLDLAAQSGAPDDTTDWSNVALAPLIDHIVDTHHAFLRRELPRLDALLSRVVQAHGDDVTWLSPTLEVFRDLRADLVAHMQSEEERVFPSIRALASGDADGIDREALNQMIGEHEEAGAALAQLQDQTNGYTPPADACPKFRAAMDGLEALERDMHRHVHKENNILFPRARTQASA